MWLWDRLYEQNYKRVGSITAGYTLKSYGLPWIHWYRFYRCHPPSSHTVQTALKIRSPGNHRSTSLLVIPSYPQRAGDASTRPVAAREGYGRVLRAAGTARRVPRRSGPATRAPRAPARRRPPRSPRRLRRPLAARPPRAGRPRRIRRTDRRSASRRDRRGVERRNGRFCVRVAHAGRAATLGRQRPEQRRRLCGSVGVRGVGVVHEAVQRVAGDRAYALVVDRATEPLRGDAGQRPRADALCDLGSGDRDRWRVLRLGSLGGCLCRHGVSPPGPPASCLARPCGAVAPLSSRRRAMSTGTFGSARATRRPGPDP